MGGILRKTAFSKFHNLLRLVLAGRFKHYFWLQISYDNIKLLLLVKLFVVYSIWRVTAQRWSALALLSTAAKGLQFMFLRVQ